MVVFLLFLALFLQTAFHPAGQSGGPVDLFFDLDPLVLLTVWIGGHAAAAVLLLSLITVAVTLFFGRWFCGWFCPFGALHNFMTSLRGQTKKNKIAAGGYTRQQKIKYLILLGVLVAALCGSNLAGWLDPFSLFFRSMTMAVFPAVDSGVEHFFGLIYQLDPSIGSLHLTALTEPVYRWLRFYLLSVSQPHYFWSMILGVLFGVVVALNLLRGRFWCKYLCPLGALLGVIGKNPTVRLETNLSKCHDCKICRMDCQGGADPNGSSAWKPSECFFCMNCQSACPSDAIQLKFGAPAEQEVMMPESNASAEEVEKEL
jgi:polyferredoxin